MYWVFVATVLAAAQGAHEHAPEPAAGGAPAPAPTPEEKKKLEEEIAKELGASPAPPTAPAPTGQAPAAGAVSPSTGGNPLARLLLLPDLSAIGSGALAWNRLDVETLSPRSDPFAPAHTVKPLFQELELAVQAVVDPYARADIFLSFAPEGAGVEEAYLTALRLPLGLQARAGELFAPFGRINQQHAHVWDFVDRPLALARLAGADALRGPGVDVAWLAPVPWFAELHLGYQSLAPGFLAGGRNAGLVRLVQFLDVGEASSLGVGLSGALLAEPGAGEGAWRELAGADVYLKVRAARSRSYLALQGEVAARRLTAAAPELAAAAFPETAGTAWGGYAQALWRDGPYLAYGARYERAPAVPGGPEHRASLLASFLPSEFERLRLQLSYDRLPGGLQGLEAIVHLEFAIGIHGAHPF